MSDGPPERFTISLPPDSEIGLDELDKMVEESDFESRSEYVRAAIMDDERDTS